MTKDSLDHLTVQTAHIEHRSFSLYHFFTWITLLIALSACAGMGYLYRGEQKSAARLQNILDSHQAQITALQSKTDQAQASLQSTLQKALASVTIEQTQTNNQLVLSTVAYLVRMANLALIINQNPNGASHFLDLAQSRIKDIPSMESLRTNIIDQKQQIDALPKVDTVGLLMQIQGVAQQVMSLPDSLQWTQPSKAPLAKPDQKATTLSQQSSADWQTFWSWFKRFVIIEHHDTNPAILITPEHFQNVKDNTYTNLTIAQWAVLHNNPQVYAKAIQQAITLLGAVTQNNPTQAAQIINSLNTLSKVDLSANYPNLDQLMNQIMSMQEILLAPSNQDITSPATTVKSSAMSAESNQRALAPDNQTVQPITSGVTV
jgi:uroporphyrin-3 C-methyltransferase